MKLNCDYFKLRKERKRTALVKRIMAERNWHKWFAWYPVPIALGECLWLETVERCNKVSKHMPEYQIYNALYYDWFMDDHTLVYNYRALSPSVQHNPDKNI